MWQPCFQVVMLRWIAPFITESSITSGLDPENTLYVIMLASVVLLQGGFHSLNIRHLEEDMEAPSAVKGEIWKTLMNKMCSLSEVLLILFFLNDRVPHHRGSLAWISSDCMRSSYNFKLQFYAISLFENLSAFVFVEQSLGSLQQSDELLVEKPNQCNIHHFI